MKIAIVFLPLFWAQLISSASVSRVINLGPYAIEPNSLTVSGLSAGGAFATQFHVAFSSSVVGVGIFAGLPCGCARGTLSNALTCMSSPGLTNVNTLVSRTDSYVTAGKVDPTSNMANDKVYIFQGTADTTVYPGNADKIKTYYDHFITSASNYLIEDTMRAAHGFPTDNYGTACATSNSQVYINNCNYKGAYEMLNFLYGGNLIQPSVAGDEDVPGNLFEFDQSDFFTNPGLVSMDSVGYIYIPTECQDPTRICKLHIAFHGCQQGRYKVDDLFVRNAGYLEVAELNGIIVLFPQAVSSALLSNPNGCFDWWSYVDNDYDSREGTQMKAIMEMVKTLSGTRK